MKIEFLPEPELEFGDGGTHIDVRFGIMQHGPLDRGTAVAPRDVKVGIIGTENSIEALISWIEKCRNGIAAKQSHRSNLFPRFPGFSFESCFGAKVILANRWLSAINPREIHGVMTESEPDRTVHEAVALFLERAREICEEGGPMVLICAPPPELLSSLESYTSSQPDPIDAEIDEGGDQVHKPSKIPAFHDLLKAKAMELSIPIQMIRQDTYLPSSMPNRKRGSTPKRSLQDEATRAWNLHTALYYKAGGIPWRLIRDPSELTTCFVGISFYQTLDRQRVLTSMAQVFNERGEGIIVKGAAATQQKEDRTPHISEEDSYELLVRAIKAYRAEHRTPPARIVIHKTSKTNLGEVKGFIAAAQEERIESIDILSVSRSLCRLFRHGTYPPLRGTLLHLDQLSALLYLRGSVNFFETYPGLYVPRPFEFHFENAISTPRAVANEIFALSKLNWNNTQFDGGEPITVRAARRVGDILKHVPEGGRIQNRYRFYM